MNDFFLVKAFALSDKLDGAIISAINILNDLMNHECIKDLSMKISVEFEDQGSRFLSKIQTYIFTVPSPCNRRTIVSIESVQHLPYQSI